jgi:competence protein ComEA
LININTATAEELEQLPQIGSAKAEAIVAYRAEHGPFLSLDELNEVTGIGEAIIEVIKDLVTLGP